MPKKKIDLDKEREIWKKQMKAKGVSVDDNQQRKDNTPEWLKRKIPLLLVLLGIYLILVPLLPGLKGEGFSLPALFFSFAFGGFCIVNGVKRWQPKNNRENNKKNN